MTLKEKLQSNKIGFWIGTALGALLVAGLVLTLVMTNLPAKKAPAPKLPEPTQHPPLEKATLTPQDFQYDGDYLTCIAAPTMLGIDISQHQGQINWTAVKSAGVEFVMIRVGGRGYGAEGILYTDDLAETYYAEAKAAGLSVGVYFFSQATSVEEARQEAELTLERIQGWQLDFPVVYDWERLDGTARTANIDQRTVTDCMKTFCDIIKGAGFRPMVYFNPDHSTSMFYIEEVTGYDFWLAMYTDWMTYPYKVDMWQYTNKGSVPGIDGDVDINLYFPEAE